MSPGLERQYVQPQPSGLGHATDLLADGEATGPQVRFLADRLTDSLHQVQRIAESRGS